MKKTLSLILALAMVVSMLSGIHLSVGAASGEVYELVTGDTITPGKYVIVDNAYNVAMTNTVASNWVSPTSTTYSGDTVTGPADSMVWNISDTGVISSADSSLGTSNALYSSAVKKISLSASGTQWSFAKNTDGTWSISASVGYLCYNYNNGNGGWRPYASTSSTLKSAVRFYKLSEGAGVVCEHTNYTVSEVVEPTCTTAGYTGYVCNDCGYEWTVNHPALGHSYDEGVITSEPTCIYNGEITYTCATCGNQKLAAVAATGEHIWEASDDGQGNVVMVCNLCGLDLLDFQKADTLYETDFAILVCEAKLVEFNGINTLGTPYGTSTAYTDAPIGAVRFVVELNGQYYRFYSDYGYLAWTSGNSLSLDEGVEDETTGEVTYSSTIDWTVSFDADGNAVISPKDTTRVIRYNPSSPRFACYTSGQTAVQLYRISNESPCQHNMFHHAPVPHTCTQDGLVEYYECMLCGRCYLDAEGTERATVLVDPADHSWESVSYTEGTCLAPFVEEFRCTVCGETMTIVGEENGTHSFEGDACAVCGAAFLSLLPTVTNGARIVIYHPVSGMAMTATAGTDVLVGIETPSGNGKMVSVNEAAVLTIQMLDGSDTYFYLKNDLGYLTSAPTGKGLSLCEPNEYSIWYLEGVAGTDCVMIHNLNAAYQLADGTVNPQALEYYKGNFTTFSHQLTDAFEFQLYEVVTTPCEHANTETITNPATCTGAGSIQVVCVDCGLALSTNILTALGHDYSGSSCSICGVEFVSLMSDLTDGAEVVIYHPTSQMVMTANSVTVNGGTRLAGAQTQADEGKMAMTEDAVVLTVEMINETDFYLKSGDLYLTSAPTGNGLCLAAADDYSIWYVETVTGSDRVYIHNRNAVYSEKAQSLEFYRDNFTTFNTATTEAYQFQFYAVSAQEPEIPVDSNLVFYASSISLEDKVIFTALASNTVLSAYDIYYVEFVNLDSDDDRMSLYKFDMGTPYNSKYTLFQFPIFVPQMTDRIEATLYGVKNGVTYKGRSVIQSVEKFALTLAGKMPAGSDLQKMTINMLQYGAMMQVNFGYRLDHLANDELGEYADLVVTTVPTAMNFYSVSAYGRTGATWKAHALSIGSSVQLQYMFALSSGVSAEGIYVEVMVDDVSHIIQASELVAVGSNYAVIFEDLLPTQADAFVTVTVYNANGEALSETVTDTLASNVAGYQSSGNVNLRNAVNAMLNYYHLAEAAYS